MPATNVNFEQKFYDRVRLVKPKGCWLWTGSRSRSGYGYFHLAHKKYVRAHRWSYEHFVGPIPKGKELHHKCENRLCVNPDHLVPVTHLQNVRMGAVGRGEVGTKISDTRKRMIAEGELVHDGRAWVLA